jgi:hypothetical protein
MDREQITALRDVLGLILNLPDSVRAQIVQWLAPEDAKANGHDHHPPAVSLTRSETSAPAKPSPKAHRGKPFSPQAADRRVLAVMRDNPGSSINVLARAAASSRTATGERLRKLAGRGAVEKDHQGRWKIAGEEARIVERPAEGPTQPSPS